MQFVRRQIHGFDQEKLVEFGIDHDGALILSWFASFTHSGKMRTMQLHGVQMYWVLYQNVLDALPVLGIKTKRALKDKFDKLVNAGVLHHYHDTMGGSFSYYGFAEKFLELEYYTPMQKTSQGMLETHPPYEENFAPPRKFSSDPLGSFLPSKDSNKEDISKEDSSKKNTKKKNDAGTAFEADEIPQTFYEYATAKNTEFKTNINIHLVFENFKTYWQSSDRGVKGFKKDWDATWRTWFLRAIENERNKPQQRGNYGTNNAPAETKYEKFKRELYEQAEADAMAAAQRDRERGLYR